MRWLALLALLLPSYASAAGGLLLGAPTSASPFVLNVSYNGSAPANFQTAVGIAKTYIQAHFCDAVTINVEFTWTVLGGGILAQTQPANAQALTFSQLKTVLTNAISSADDAIAVASLGSTDPTGTDHIYMPFAQAKPLGLRAANSPVLDILSSVNSSSAWTYDNSGGVTPGTFDLPDILVHEVTHGMGRIPLLGTSTYYTTNDLFRWTAAGTRKLTTGGNPYFSIDGGVTNSGFAYDATSNADWDGATLDAFNAVITPSVLLPIANTDLVNMDILGFKRCP